MTVLGLLGGHLEDPLIELITLPGPRLSILLRPQLSTLNLILQVFILIEELLILSLESGVVIKGLLSLHFSSLEL